MVSRVYSQAKAVNRRDCMDRLEMTLRDELEALITHGMNDISARRELILRVQERMECMPNKLGMSDFATVHHHAGGVYVREVFLPAGTLVVGRTHLFDHHAFLMVGEVLIFAEDEIVRVQAPRLWQSPKGTKRIVYAHTDAVFLTTHASDETDPDTLMKTLTVKDYADMLALERAT